MIEKNVNITNKTGLHARPASDFVKLAKTFTSDVKISFNNKTVNAKSIMHVLSLTLVSNSTVTLSIDGEDEEKAMEALSNFLTNLSE